MPVFKSISTFLNPIPTFLYDKLNSLIQDDNLASNKDKFVKNASNFSRRSPLSLRVCVHAMFCFDNHQLFTALRNALPASMKEDMPTVSAFTQQRSKLKLEGFKYIFEEMVKAEIKRINRKLLRNRFILVCADGSDFPVPTDTLADPNDPSLSEAERKKAREELKKRRDAQRAVQRRKLHVNALLDIRNHMYLAADMRPKLACNERTALLDILDAYKSSNPDTVPANMIVMCDRGYASYHLFTSLALRGFKFIIRVKAPSSNGILKNSKYQVESDCVLDKTFTMAVNPDENGIYDVAAKEIEGVTRHVKVRVVSKKLKDGTYGYWLTNLWAPIQGRHLSDRFSRKDIISLYAERWEIETSFRYLKYGLGGICFHSRKLEIQKMEVYIAMTLLNCIMAIVSHTRVTNRRKDNKYRYKINITAAVEICMDFLLKGLYTPQTLRRELLKHLVKYEPGRWFPRNVKHDDKTVKFLYRPR